MAKHPRTLTGQVAAITGGARGIGRAMAEAFVRQGMRVAIGDVDAEAAQRTADELGAGTVALPLDVTDRASVDAFVAGVEGRLGPVDVFVNNAGIMTLSPLVDEDDAAARRMVDINVHGVLFGMKAVLPGMIARNRGHVVNIASAAGKLGFAGGATYTATKFAVVGLAEAMRSELRLMGADGVALSVVMPAIVATELGGGLRQPVGQKPLRPEQVADAVVDALRTGRFDVWVPSENKALFSVTSMLPRGAREGVARLMRTDRALWDADAATRRDYELRAARSEPALAPAPDPAELAAAAPEREAAS